MRNFGFGTRVGIGASGKASGYARRSSQWSKTSSYNIPTGQEITEMRRVTAMFEVVNRGSGQSVHRGGKCSHRTIFSSFVGFVLPKIYVLHDGHTRRTSALYHGGTVSAPVFKEVMKAVLLTQEFRSRFLMTPPIVKSARKRPGIPIDSGHPFRCKAATYSD